MTSTEAIPSQNGWLIPVGATPEPPLSERLIRALEAHVAAEAHDLGECERLSESVQSTSAHVLLGLIVDEARRHQILLRQLIERLAEEPDPTQVNGVRPRGIQPDPEAAAVVRTLVRDEQEGARYLRHLARQHPHLDDGLCAVLLESIARDSEKHAHLLRYLLRRFESH